jgi:hypothetical protein
MIRAPVTMALPFDSKKTLIRHRLKQSIKRAKLICPNFEQTIECAIAWDEVNDLTRALHDQRPAKPRDVDDDELADRIYDM